MARFVTGPKCRNAVPTHLGGNRQKIAECGPRKVGNSALLVSERMRAALAQVATDRAGAVYTLGILVETERNPVILTLKARS